MHPTKKRTCIFKAWLLFGFFSVSMSTLVVPNLAFCQQPERVLALYEFDIGDLQYSILNIFVTAADETTLSSISAIKLADMEAGESDQKSFIKSIAEGCKPGHIKQLQSDIGCVVDGSLRNGTWRELIQYIRNNSDTTNQLCEKTYHFIHLKANELDQNDKAALGCVENRELDKKELPKGVVSKVLLNNKWYEKVVTQVMALHDLIGKNVKVLWFGFLFLVIADIFSILYFFRISKNLKDHFSEVLIPTGTDLKQMVTEAFHLLQGENTNSDKERSEGIEGRITEQSEKLMGHLESQIGRMELIDQSISELGKGIEDLEEQYVRQLEEIKAKIDGNNQSLVDSISESLVSKGTGPEQIQLSASDKEALLSAIREAVTASKSDLLHEFDRLHSGLVGDDKHPLVFEVLNRMDDIRKMLLKKSNNGAQNET